MASGTITGTTSNQYITSRIVWSSVSNTEGNYSNVTATLSYRKSSSSSSLTGGTFKGNLYINGVATPITKKTNINNNNTWVEFGTATVKVNHNADGAKSITIYATGGMSGTTFTSTSCTGTVALDTIPRATTPTTSGTLNVGSAVTINTPRAASSFTHTLQYSLDNSTWTNIATGVATSYSWTLPSALATAKTSAKTGTVYIRCITYSGSTNIGNKTISRTYNITSSYASPSAGVTVSQTNAAGISRYICGKSTVTLQVTATLKYNATAAKYVFTYGGVSKTITTSASTASISFKLPTNAAEAYAWTVVLTDSRGYTVTKSGTITTVAYTAPNITSFSVKRGHYDGTTFTENPKGYSLKINATGTISNVSNLNAKKYKIEYRLRSDTTYYTLIAETTADAYSVVVSNYTAGIFDVNLAFVMRFTLTDSFHSSASEENVPSQQVMLNFSADGKHMSIGGIASEEVPLGVEFTAKFNQPVYGQVMGLSYLPPIPENSDLNDYTSTGSYAIRSNAIAEAISNMPIAKAGRLEISSATGREVGINLYNYIRQKFIPYMLEFPIYERDITQNGTSTWIYGAWRPTSLQGYGYGSKILWSGSWYMNADHSITLTEKISDQLNGISLVFSRYANGVVEDSNFNSFFVSKHLVAAMPGMGTAFFMSAVNFSYVCSKYLYISDDRITGNDLNSTKGTNNGITYNNAAYVLRYVIGV